MASRRDLGGMAESKAVGRCTADFGARGLRGVPRSVCQVRPWALEGWVTTINLSDGLGLYGVPTLRMIPD